MATNVQQHVDALLDKVEAEQPGIAHSITLAPVNALLLPVQGTELLCRGVEGPLRGHIYRNCLVWEQEIFDYVVIVSPVVDRSLVGSRKTRFFADLRDGRIGIYPPFFVD
ncbi:hypothetical protein C5C55_08700 [Rathayibacter sp. AY1C2]|uniref:hypothetical protein n=1 Tax=Rathayibacter sp. AY1C2 TaxID=2080535 RepID=UPI000CE89BD3|nr:hypothetical protein [Rathayibacter sp. AY1C2]PPF56577.1 hypothetical protein C5C55_08700 [Rathayibacter sp. AY1C2]